MGPILMTEDGKKPGVEGAGQPDPLSATGMFLNAFETQPEQPAEQEQESAGQWFAAEDKSGAALGGAKLGGPWGQPLNAPSVPASVGETTPGRGQAHTRRIYTDVSQAGICSFSRRQVRRQKPAPLRRYRQEPGEFTRMFVRATASMPATADACAI